MAKTTPHLADLLLEKLTANYTPNSFDQATAREAVPVIRKQLAMQGKSATVKPRRRSRKSR